MARGADNEPVIPQELSPDAKSIGNSMTLDRDCIDMDRLKAYSIYTGVIRARGTKAEVRWFSMQGY